MTPPDIDREHHRLALEQLALDAVGCLGTDDNERWVREHVANGCAICLAARARVEHVFDDLLLLAPPVPPSPSLRARVLAIARGASRADTREATREAARDPAREATPDATPARDPRVWNQWRADALPKFTTLAAADGDWEPIDFPGIEVRRLFVDEAADSVTMLIRMAAGASYPAHRHAGHEQCLVLAGDLRIEDRVLHAGDFQLAPSGSLHGVQSTENGCTLLIVSSRRDELLT